MKNIYILSEPQNHRCCYCGNQMVEIKRQERNIVPRDAMTREHFIPKSYGGPTEKENLVAACQQCNEMRGNMDAVAFYNLIQKWFKRDETLRSRWHSISREERYEFKLRCLRTQERHLSGLSRKYNVYILRHAEFVYHNRRRLKA